MNRERLKGFVCGVLLCILVLALTSAALGAKRSVEISEGIRITINGVPFLPKDASGKAVPVFTCNGTTYVPLRAVSQAAGFQVDYDSASRTAVLKTPEYAAAADPKSGSFASAEKAREAALADAGVSAKDALFLKTCLDWENGRAVYEVEFCAGNREYDYELDAVTCRVLRKDYDCDDFDWPHHEDGHHGQHTGSASQPPANLIMAEKAKAIALARLPGGTVRKCELEMDDGRWEYELELRQGNREYECVVDAISGAVLKWELDD